jgi:hypothetical protein
MFDVIKETYEDLVNFLKSPADVKDCNQTCRQKAKRLFSILAIHIPIMGICIAMVFSVTSLASVNLENHRPTALLQQHPIWKIALLAIVIVPLVEELAFRLYLRFKNNNLVHAIILISSVTGKHNKARTEKLLLNVWSNHFGSVFYGSAIIFALVHCRNYDYHLILLLLTPLVILPQFVAGLFLGYLRIRYSLAVSYMMHAIHNAVLLLLTLYPFWN